MGRFDGSGAGKFATFRDKSEYKPTFQLSYTDKDGNPLTEKESFRLLSHKFHGQQSGKIKTEKRQKKRKEMQIANRSTYNSSSIMMDVLTKKQQTEKTAFAVIAGARSGKGAGTQNLKK